MSLIFFLSVSLNLFFFFFALCSAKVDTGSAHRDGTSTMMSPGVSSSLSKQLDGRENSAICLKGKQQQSIAFSLQLCFHTAVEAGCLALLNDTLVPPHPSPSPCQSLAPESCHCDDTGALG